MNGTYTGNHWDLAGAGNGNCFGMAIDDNNIWTSDTNDYLVYEWTLSGGAVGSWSVTGGPSGQARGLYSDGSFVWGAVLGEDLIYKWNTAGAEQDTWATGNNESYGITSDDTNIWVSDNVAFGSVGKIYKYDMSGNFDSKWSLDTDNAHSRDITINGSHMWHVDWDDEMVYVYDYIFAPTDTCTCAGLNQNWEVDHSDYCNLGDCELGTGKLNFTGSGETSCTGNINTTDRGGFGAGNIFWYNSTCLINVK